MPQDVHSLIAISFAMFLVACPGPDPAPRTDADVIDADAEVEVDAEAEIDADPDHPSPDGNPPICEDLPAAMSEITPDPTYAQMPYVAAGEVGFAVLWLAGDGGDRDVMFARLDTDLTLTGDPIVVAASRRFAADPSVVWSHNGWTVAWSDATTDETCESEDDCRRELRLQRVSAEGTVEGEPLEPWGGLPILTRAALVATDAGTQIVVLGRPETSIRLLSGRTDPAVSTATGPDVINEDQSIRQGAPTAVRVGDSLVAVAEASPGGLVGFILDATTGGLLTGPIRVVENVSASAPALALRGGTLGLTYIDTDPTPPGNRILLVELDDELRAEQTAVIVAEHNWPRNPQIIDAGGGWIVVWHDGRNDHDDACVNLAFCRDDVFLISASLAGPNGDPLRLSEDPNDCRAPVIARHGAHVTTAWLTFRDDRRTIFGRVVSCE